MTKYTASELPQVAKACKNCGKLKCGKDFYKSSRNEDGLTTWCAACLDKLKEPQSRYKKCKKCGQNREKWNFFKSENQSDGLSVWCKPCHAKNNR